MDGFACSIFFGLGWTVSSPRCILDGGALAQHGTAQHSAEGVLVMGGWVRVQFSTVAMDSTVMVRRASERSRNAGMHACMFVCMYVTRQRGGVGGWELKVLPAASSSCWVTV
jgi:hypothetical protein